MTSDRVKGAGDLEDTLRAKRVDRSPAEQRARLISGAAWDDFCEALRRSGRALFEAGDATEAELAAGHRYLLGLVVSGIQQATCLADPQLPTFIRNPDSTSKWGAENADNQYLWTRIDPRERYRISGTRGGAYEILFEVKEGYMQLGDARNFATLDASELEVDADGRFEIELSQERAGASGNWLPIDGDARYLAIRVYFYDWANEGIPEFRIERLGDGALETLPLETAAAAEMLDGAADWIESSAIVWKEWSDRTREAHVPGQLAPARSYVGGADDIFYGNDWFELDPGSAMIIETELPNARYWSFQLGSPWFHSLDFANRLTSLNGRQAHVDSDGRLRVVVAHEDPGVANWLDTTGLQRGLLQYRWIWTSDNPRPRVETVAFDGVREALPADTPRVDAAQRRRQIAERKAHVWRRERWS